MLLKLLHTIDTYTDHHSFLKYLYIYHDFGDFHLSQISVKSSKTTENLIELDIK